MKKVFANEDDAHLFKDSIIEKGGVARVVMTTESVFEYRRFNVYYTKGCTCDPGAECRCRSIAEDLGFNPHSNPTIDEVCRAMGERTVGGDQ